MKTTFSYPSEKNDFNGFCAANPTHKVKWKGNKVLVLTGDDIPAAPVAECDPLQFRLALAAMDLRGTVDAYLATADAFKRAWFESAKSFKADNPMLIEVATAMGLLEQLPTLFAVAKTMPSA